MSDPLTLAAPLPALAPLGLPLLVTLTSAALPNASPVLRQVQLDLSAPAGTAGVVVTLDGYRFTSGPLIVPGRFVDAESLAAALSAVPVLAATYDVAQPSTDQVQLTARDYVAGGLNVSASGPARVSVNVTFPGQPARYDQSQYRWAAFLDVWAGCGQVYGDAPDLTQATQVLRLTQDYDPGGSYTFDIAPALRTLTGHNAPDLSGTLPDRLVSYFVRYGEEYADAPTGLRRVRSSYDSDVAWGLEAVTVPDDFNVVRLLTARPAPWHVAPGDRVPCGVLLPDSTGVQLVARTRLATTRTTTDTVLPSRVDVGQVRQPDRLTVPDGTLSGSLCVLQAGGPRLLVGLVFDAVGPALSFANRQGSYDTVRFGGTPDDSGKRTGGTYQGAAGVQQLSADYQPTRRLYSGLLDFATWDWLRQELAVSPAVELETDAGPVALTVADVVAEADHATGTYSLYVDLQPPAVRGLSN